MILRLRTAFFVRGMKQLIFGDYVPSFCFPIIGHYSQGWCPTSKFSNPIRDGGVRNDDKGRGGFPLLDDSPEKGHNLDCLALFEVNCQ